MHQHPGSAYWAWIFSECSWPALLTCQIGLVLVLRSSCQERVWILLLVV